MYFLCLLYILTHDVSYIYTCILDSYIYIFDINKYTFVIMAYTFICASSFTRIKIYIFWNSSKASDKNIKPAFLSPHNILKKLRNRILCFTRAWSLLCSIRICRSLRFLPILLTNKLFFFLCSVFFICPAL